MPQKVILRAITIIVFIVSILWLIVEPGFEPLVGFLATAVTGLLSLRVTDNQDKPDTSSEDNNIRRELLKVVGDEFASRLEQMLTDDIRAELGLNYTPEAVQHRDWLNKSDLPAELSADADILTIFDKAHGKLLMIGAPGAGKTTTLIRLGAQLIEQARQHPDKPVPILFELSRWQVGQPIRDWLAAELKDQYALTIERWLEWLNPANPRILPLLDGFDEVPEAHREMCAEAINTFAHDLTVKLVVCSRVQEYALLQTKLQTVNALQINELEIPQITAYLARMGTDTMGLQAALMHDTDLLDMAQQPLLLNTLVLAYRGEGEVTDFENAATEEERRKALFDSYIRTRLKNKEKLFLQHFEFAEKFQKMNPVQRFFIHHFRTAEIEYADDDTRKWLAWLASQMELHAKMQVFEIEGLQSDWLANDQQQKHFIRLARLALGVAVGVAATVTVMGVGAVGGKVGIPVGGAICLAVIAAVVMLENGGMIESVERLQWSTKAAFQHWRQHMAIGAAGGIGGCLGMILAGISVRGIAFAALAGGISGMAVGVAVGVASVLDGGFASEKLIGKTRPNEGILQSRNNAVRFGFLYSVIFSLAVGVAFSTFGYMLGNMLGAMVWRVIRNMILGTSSGIAVGIFWSIMYKGGVPALSHVALREVLWKQGYAPYNYARFLDYCVKLRLLVRVGGSYKFMHRLLQEHFAATYSPPSEVQP